MEITKPWQITPTELLKQAINLLRYDTEVTRQMAFLLIDVGVETIFKTFLLLSDSITGVNVEYGERAAATKKTFHDLKDMIKKAAKDRITGIDLEKVKYYHDIRNKLYHQGDGIIPTAENTEDYMNISTELLYRLLSVDLRPLLLEEQRKNELIADRTDLVELELKPIQKELNKYAKRIEEEMINQLYEEESIFAKPSFGNEMKDYFKENTHPNNQRWKSGLRRLVEYGLLVIDDEGNVITNYLGENIPDYAYVYLDERPGGPPPEIPEDLWELPSHYDEDRYFEIILADDFTEALILITDYTKDFPKKIDVEDYRDTREIINWDFESIITNEDFESKLSEKINHGKYLLNQFYSLDSNKI